MNLFDYASILLRRGWIMLLLAAAAAGAAFIFSSQMDPVYRSTQKVLIIPSRSDFGLTQASITLLNSRVAYLDSELVAQNVINELSLDMLPGELLGATTISSNRDSMLIQIDVDLYNGDLANDIARVWGDELVRYQNELNQEARREDRINARPQDNPSYYLLSPNLRINTLVGALAGLFIGGVIVFVLEYLESSIVRRREDLERGAGLPVLAAVPAD